MGRDLYEDSPSVKAIFDRADSELGFSLSRLCFEGPEEELKRTINAQPALVTMSYACLEAARESAPHALPPAAFAAGHSVGEYTALAAAGVFDFATAVHLARERGRLMYEAGLVKPGTMFAIIGMDEAPLTEVCRETGAWIANINCPGQIVISGEIEKVKKGAELSKSKGAKYAIPLQVSGAFHSPLMQPAVDGMSRAFSAKPFNRPAIPVVGNTGPQILDSAESVRAELLEQLCHCVQWQRSIEYMVSQGVSTFIEIGPGEVLSGLIGRINREARTMNLGDAQGIESLAHQEA